MRHETRVPIAALLASVLFLGCGAEQAVPPALPAESLEDPTNLRSLLGEEALASIRAQEAERSRAALIEVERRFSLPSPRVTFRIRKAHTDGLGNTHVRIQQLYAGVPVEGRDIGVVVPLDGSLEIYGTPDDFGSALAAGKRNAGRVAHKARAFGDMQGLKLAERDGEPVIEPRYVTRLRPGRVWVGEPNSDDYETVVERFERGTLFRVETAPGEFPRASHLFVRDSDGSAELRGEPKQVMAPATLRTRLRGTLTTVPTSFDDRSSTFDLFDARGNGVVGSAGPRGFFSYAKPGPNTWGNGLIYNPLNGPSSTNGETAAADAYVALVTANSFLSLVLGRNGWDNAGDHVVATVHANIDNARWGMGQIIVGYVDLATKTTSLADIEILGHEVGHGVLDSSAGIPYSDIGELGGLQEGSGDIFGVLTGFHFPFVASGATPPIGRPRLRVTPVDNWVMGDKIIGGGSERSFIMPLVDHWSVDILATPAHYAGGPLTRMFYFLSVGVLPAGNSPQSIALTAPQVGSIFLQRGLEGIGTNNAALIWYQTLQHAAFSRVTSYSEARDVALLAVQQLFTGGSDSPQYWAVEDAFAAVNVGLPAQRFPPKIVMSFAQQSRTQATLTVDITDDGEVTWGQVQIGTSVLQPCTGHCVLALDPLALGPGTHTARVSATDNKNHSVTQDLPFFIDLEPPSATVTDTTSGNGNPNGYYKRFDATAIDPKGISAARVLVDGVVHTTLSYNNPVFLDVAYQSVSLWNVASGWRAISLEVVDSLGNAASAPLNPLFRDRTPPDACDVAATVTSNWSVVQVTATGRDVGSGIRYLWVLIDGSSWVGLNGLVAPGVQSTRVKDTPPLSPGLHRFRIQCEDAQLNTTLSPERTVNIVAPPPPPPPPTSPCNTTTVAGDSMPSERSFSMGQTSGTVTFQFQAFNIHDRFRVLTPSGTTLADTGCTAGSGSLSVTFSGASTLKVRVDPNCDPGTAGLTEWNHRLSCP